MNKQTIYFLFLFSIINIVSYAQVIEKKTKDDSKNTGNIIALLNSEQITDKRYNELLKDKLEYLYQSGSKNDLNSGIEDACFSQMIDEQLMIQEASKLGINVTYDFAFKILLDNPPQFVQDMFKSPNGNFRSDVYKQVIQNPMLITRYVNKPGKSEKQVTDEWKKDIIQLVNFVKREEVKKQLGNKLYKDKPLSTKMVLDRYFAEKTLITGSVVRAHHLSIPDSLVPVSDIEAKAWYEAHKSDYNFTESRYISSMIFQMSPTRSDSIKLKRSMDSVVKKCNETPKEKRPEYITSVMRNLPESKLPNGSFYTPSKVPKPLLEIVVKSKEGDIIGPIVQGFDASLIYIDKISQSNDTMIRARHIFLKAANDYNSDSSYVELLKKIRDTIKSDADFADYAQRFGQDGTLTKGGDLGYLGKGNTVHTFDSALFQNPSIGKLIGPIRTEFGHHLIYISDIWNKGYNIRELRFPYQISEKVQEDVEDNSQKFYDLLKAGKMNDSIAQAMKNKFQVVLLIHLNLKEWRIMVIPKY
ncbi:MAG: peptidylprolyl isomerase [Chlorobi bacterium]|nr:peptidylprolyl isomerase [Chlorobiota bacterium]